IDKLILDGIFVSFYDTIKRHTIAEGHNPFPVVNEIPSLFRKCVRVDIMKYTPLKRIRKVDVPILFIHSRVDVFSLPKNLALIVEASPSVNKTVVWFEKGGHSHIRINNEEKYDETILSFLRK
ncbi:MAG: alpha/beta hydrolase, partial [Bacilli bacterium]